MSLPPQHTPLLSIRTTEDLTKRLILEISAHDPLVAPMVIHADAVRYIDARGVPEVFWNSVAKRMDDAYNEGLPLWHYLTGEECRALADDRIDVVPDTLADFDSIAIGPVHTADARLTVL